MDDDVCGKETGRGWPCRFPAKGCPHHDRAGEPDGDAADVVGLDKRDSRELGWRLVERVARGQMGVRQGARLLGLVMQMHRLGPEPEDEELVLRRVELMSMVMAGMPPRNEREWALAEETFDADMMAELRRREARLPGGGRW